MKNGTSGKIILIATGGLLLTGCGITKGYKKPEKATNATIDGSVKMSELTNKVGGCDRGLFIVEAMKDYTQESGGFRIQGNGFVAKEPTKINPYAVLSDGKKPDKHKDPEFMDLGANLPVTVGGDLSASTTDILSAASADVNIESITGEEERVNPEVIFNRDVNGKYSVTNDKTAQSLGGVTNADIRKFTLARSSAGVAAEGGVGFVKSAMLGATGVGYGGYKFPTDVEPISEEMKKISGNVKDGFAVKLGKAVAIAGTVPFVTIEIRNYPATNSAKDWRAAFRVADPSIDAAEDVVLKVPAAGKLKEGNVVVDITRSSLAGPKAADAAGGVLCTETRSTVRVYGNIGPAPKEEPKK